MALAPFGKSKAASGPSGVSGNMPKRVSGSGKMAASTSPSSRKVSPGGSDRNNTPKRVSGAPSGNGKRINP